MEFLTKLQERNLGDNQAIQALGIFGEEQMSRMYKGFVFGPYTLSVQASYYHYCSPRKTLPNDLYSSMEIAVIKDNEFVSIAESDDFADFQDRYLIHDSWDYGVYACVDVKLIESLYQFLKQKYEIVEV